MNKFSKIAISFLLIISIIFNPFGTVLDVRSEAVVGETIAYVLGCVCLSIAVSAAAELATGVVEWAVTDGADAVIDTAGNTITNYNNIVNDWFNNGDNVILCDSDYYYLDDVNTSGYICRNAYVNPDLGLTGEELAIAQAVCDGINSHIANGSNPDLVFDVNPANGGYWVSPETYSNLKEIVVNSMTAQTIHDVCEATGTISSALDTPVYDFDFVGPLPTMVYPTKDGLASLQKEGFVYSPAIPLGVCDEQGYFASEASARSYFSGFDVPSVYYNEQYGYQPTFSWTGYGGGCYILYDGEIYYYNESGYIGSQYTNSRSPYIPNQFYQFPYAVSASGTVLSSVYKEGDSFSFGFYYNKTGEVQGDMPKSVTFTEEDFNQTTGGGTVELPRTEAEEIIGNAIGVGLITPDSTLEIGADGAITAVDGIELAKLQEICDALAQGNLQFENVQEYLDLISKLISTGNYTAVEQKKLLENVNANTEAIAKAITGEYELEDTDLEFNYISVEHTGFVEAHQIVDHLAIVNQSKTLLGNLFQTVESKESNNNNVPSFSFYFDSNKDGVSEEYTLLDLSFMELPLTNANLEDKGRFQNSMTVREFIHSLIVLLAYILFAIKVIKRVPVLFGGGSLGGDVSTSDVSVSNEFQRIPIDGRRW